MSKLLVGDKDRIKEALIERAFGPREEALATREHELALAIYTHLLGAHVAAIESLPEGWLPEDEEVQVKVGGEQYRLRLSRARRVPQSFAAELKPTHPLALDAHNLTRDKAALRAQKRATSLSIHQVLNRATTAKRLLELWPEASAIVEEVLGKPADKLPVPALATLNKTLGLPPDGAA